MRAPRAATATPHSDRCQPVPIAADPACLLEVGCWGQGRKIPVLLDPRRPLDAVRRSALFRHALWRNVWRQRDPRVARLLPHRNGWRREIRVGKVAYGNGDNSWKAFVLPVDGGAAGRTEVESKPVATFGRPRPRRGLTLEGDLLASEPRLVADGSAGATLALQAVTHGDARWFALDCEVKLPATAGGAAGRHRGRFRCCNRLKHRALTFAVPNCGKAPCAPPGRAPMPRAPRSWEQTLPPSTGA